MSKARKRRATSALVFCACLTATLAFFQTFTARVVPVGRDSFAEDNCVDEAEVRLHSFLRDINRTCDDSQRQRTCQEHISRLAIPRLLNSKLVENCDAGCPVHAIISASGGKAVNELALSAFLRAFVVTQPQHSTITLWSLPWDNIVVPDITEGCSTRDLNEKLRGASWRRRIKIQRFEHADLGTFNLLKMLAYRVVGNEFRLLRSMVRLSDLLRFHLLQKYGGIYVDSDVLLLHDLTPLSNSTFAYRWSDKDAENSAVFGCPRNCRFVNEFIRSAGSTPLSYHPLKWRRTGEHDVHHWPVRLPTILFDAVWLKQIGADAQDPASYIFTKHEDFAKTGVLGGRIKSRAHAFPASLGYHWHGGFASIPETPEPKSTFSLLHDLACF